MTIPNRIARVTLLAILSCSLVGLLGRFSWFCDLFNSFRPHALVVAAVLTYYALVFRWRSCVAVGVIIIALNGGLMATRMSAFGGVETAETAATPVKLISANVLAGNREWWELLGQVGRHDPDIVIAIEVTHEWANALALLSSDYPHRLVETRPGVFGMAAYSRLPFTGYSLHVGTRRLPLLYLDFDSFVVMAAHPPPPVTAELAAEHQAYVQRIAEYVRQAGKPVIVTGDFNGTLWNDSMHPLSKAGLHSSRPSGLAWTWPSGFAPLAMQIDHVFVHGAAVKEFRVLSDIGSDHYPVMASFVPQADR